MVGGAIDNLFQSGTTPSAHQHNTGRYTMQQRNAAQGGGDFLDKISDFIPGATGEKIEEFAKDKFSGFFGSKPA